MSVEPLSALSSRFNPDLGFSLVATCRYLLGTNCDIVSIPIWVSPSSRLVETSDGTTVRLFQSRSGFLPRRDPPALRPRMWGSYVSIPIWVSPSSRLDGDRGVGEVYVFQSRSGFLPRRDSCSCRLALSSSCFNPDLGFSLVATGDRTDRLTDPMAFQSRSGFLPRRDPFITPSSLREVVSIPIWVSPSSRPSAASSRSWPSYCFNPDLGFSLVATGGDISLIGPILCAHLVSQRRHLVDPCCTRDSKRSTKSAVRSRLTARPAGPIQCQSRHRDTTHTVDRV